MQLPLQPGLMLVSFFFMLGVPFFLLVIFASPKAATGLLSVTLVGSSTAQVLIIQFSRTYISRIATFFVWT